MKRVLSAALQFATEKHAGQFDKGGYPYILHCLAVMMMIADRDDEELLAAAVLHDVIEDTDATYADLRTIGMTERVIVAVQAVTKVPGETYEEYQAKVKSNADAVVIKMCDLRHNTDVTRLKGITQRDIDRNVRYQRFYWELCQLTQEGRVS